jgi:hypothetical protein
VARVEQSVDRNQPIAIIRGLPLSLEFSGPGKGSPHAEGMKVHIVQLILVSSVAASVADAPSNRTSFVLIYLDDFGFGDASSFGNPMVQSPSIDKLVNEGMKATSFYVASPICSSSRSALLT